MNAYNLNQLHILVTRPKHLATKLCAKLEEQGARITLLPCIEIKPLAYDMTAQQLSDVNKVIFLSQNAVIHSQTLLNDLPKKVEVIAVGKATQAKLANHGWRDCIIPNKNFNSEGLLDLPTLKNVYNKNIAIVAGIGGRELLYQTLKARGAKLNKLAVYRRILPKINEQEIAKINLDEIDVILCNSNESLTNLVAIMGHQRQTMLLNSQFLGVSKRLAQLAKELGINKEVIVAKNASNAAIINALLAWKENNND